MHSELRSIRTRLCLLVAGCLLFAGCGGGGGAGGGSGSNHGNGGSSGGGSYVGATTAAKLDADSAPALVNALLFELDIGSPQSRPLPTSMGVHQFASAKRTAKSTLRAVQQKGFWSQKLTTDDCTGGGSVRTDDQTNASGIGTVTLTFTNCVEDGVRTDGTLVIRVDAFSEAMGEPSDFTITLQQLVLDAGGYSVTANGTDRIQVAAGQTTETLNTVSHYQPENLNFRLENFTATEPTASMPFGSATLEGRFYHSRYGYIDVSTAQDLRLPAADPSQPDQGVLSLRGAQPGLAKVEFTAPGTLALDVDENGDGTYERGLSANLGAWLTAANFAPRAIAGSDASINEGQSVTLDGSGSSDWEGSALTYNWTVLSGPSFGPIPAGRTVAFMPSVPGNYVIQLTVTDDRSLTGLDTMTLFVQDNATPIAVGKDVQTVERTAVMLDATASTDIENDPLQYTWRLRNAPLGTQAPTQVTGAQIPFTPDLPGEYVYDLEVADAHGSSFDQVTIFADRLISFPAEGESIYLSAGTTVQELQKELRYAISPFYTGSPVALSITSNEPWVHVTTASPRSDAPVFIAVDAAQIASLPNGAHVAELTITPQGFNTRSTALHLTVAMPRISHVSPYVGYSNQPQEVLVYGQALFGVGFNLVINGIEVPPPSTVPSEQGRVTLPALPAGEYTMYFKNNLGIQQPGGRYVVRAAPNYPNGELSLPGRVESVDYDAERDAFFIVTRDASNQTEARNLKYNGSSWQSTLIVASAPQALTLTADGSKLLVTTSNCGVLELNPVSLAQTGSRTKSSCSYEVFGMIHAFANGNVWVANTDQWPLVWLYPDFTTEYLPSVHNPIHLLSYDRSRLLWAESPTISAPRHLYEYDSALATYPIALNDPDTYFLSSNLAISGNGRTFTHGRDVYVENMFAGSLNRSADPYLTPGLTRMGTHVVVLDAVTDSLALYDLAASPPFPLLQSIGTLPDDIAPVGNRLLILPNDSTAFVFTSIADGNGNISGYKMYVRNLP